MKFWRVVAEGSVAFYVKATTEARAIEKVEGAIGAVDFTIPYEAREIAEMTLPTGEQWL